MVPPPSAQQSQSHAITIALRADITPIRPATKRGNSFGFATKNDPDWAAATAQIRALSFELPYDGPVFGSTLLAESLENAIAQTFCPAHVRVGSKSENNTLLFGSSAS